MDIVGRASRHDRMHTAGIVADHAAKRVVVMGRGIGTEGQAMRVGLRAEMIENAAWLDNSEPALHIDRQNSVHVFRKIDDD